MKRFLFLAMLAMLITNAIGQQFKANYDESQVPSYTLPDPLVFNDGGKVKNNKDWEQRRAELMEMFCKEVYGITPSWKGSMAVKELSSDMNALNGKAIRKEIAITLKNSDREITFTVLVYLPHSKSPVPVFLGYNFGGNHTVTDEPGILITKSWMRNNQAEGITENKATEAGRGKSVSQWQVRELIANGYGLVTLYYGDVDPDFDDGFKNGVHGLFNAVPDATSWGSISAWAWGLSRVMDWIETFTPVDSHKVIVMGHSRLGKTALWAGATDQRFAIVISNNSGCGGAALSKRIYGETVGSINRAFPHWFCNNFNKYNENETELPVDQHELLALIAPRPVYVASAEEDKWADPKGEFLACLNASPVYKLLGLKGFPATEMPPLNSPVMGDIGYHVRTGGHDVTLYDWQQYIAFANMHLKYKVVAH
jgi:hypothetical protein